MVYKQFTIENFKGISKVIISLFKNDLVLLLGINESGKTTILKAIEAFDYRNDPDVDYENYYYSSMRKKSDVRSNKSTKITAIIEPNDNFNINDFSELIKSSNFTSEHRQLLKTYITHVNEKKEIIISRVIPFKNGIPLPYYYELVTENPITENEISKEIAQEIVHKCPYIMYFEDFKDRIPEKIFINHKKDAFNKRWFDIIDGLFYNTDSTFSISEFKKYFSPKKLREDDAGTVLTKVNNTLNKIFTDKWKNLSGVKDIANARLDFHPAKKYFFLYIVDDDGTNYSIEERSKGALWYLSFLMKTEFRRKKLFTHYGKPIFLIDEPASNLHSTAQTNMIQDFLKLVENTSVIYSTHSQYLISLKNIKNTQIIRREHGIITCVKWSDYIKEDTSIVSYYQPLADFLNIVPNNFTIPWEKALITEGPSDMHVLSVMKKVLNIDNDFVIYPGTNAFNLGTLISLNLAWDSDFRVILDSDEAGLKAQKDYINDFLLNESIVQVLDGENKKIESCFTEAEKKKIYSLVFNSSPRDNVTKKEFRAAFGGLMDQPDMVSDVSAILGKETKSLFKKLFSRFDL